MYCCKNKSPRTLSKSIFELPSEGKFARRPFDHYRPNETSWYIIPSSELPFFKFGKFYFEFEKPGLINCGVICTKGLAPELAVVYPSKKGRRLLMSDEGWAFPHWAYFAYQNKLVPLLQTIKSNLNDIDFKIRIKGSYIDDPGVFDPYTEEKRAFDCYELAVDPAADTIKVSKAVRQAMNLKILNQVRNGETFGQAMKEIAADTFLWCDIFIGATFKVASDDEEVLAVEDIYSKFLLPLAVLVK